MICVHTCFEYIALPADTGGWLHASLIAHEHSCYVLAHDPIGLYALLLVSGIQWYRFTYFSLDNIWSLNHFRPGTLFTREQLRDFSSNLI